MSTHAAAHHAPASPANFTLPGTISKLCITLIVVGALVTAWGAFTGGEKSLQLTLASWLMNVSLYTSFAVFALFFLAINYVSKAGWHVTTRRPVEAMTAFLPFGLACMVALMFGLPHIYEWAHTGEHHGLHGHLLHHKAGYLNPTFFGIRTVIYFAIWMGFAYAMVQNSRKQDIEGGITHWNKNIRLSAAFLPLFAITYSMVGFDWLMSLQATWFSTLFGGLQFAALAQGGFAMLIVLLVLLRKLGYLRSEVNENHFNTLGQWLIACSVFWAYLWFSQMMLTWYANIPEETQYYTIRGFSTQGNPWEFVTIWLNPIWNFAIPFLLLLPRPSKRNESLLVRVCIWILIGRWIDLFITVMPNFSDKGPFGFAVKDYIVFIGMAAGFLGLFLLVVLRALRRAPMVATKDPCIEEGRHLSV